jgi:hypothetical protein
VIGGPHAFVDESKRGGYVVVAVVVASADLAGTRQQLRWMLLPGQRALHFKNEQDGRRRQLLGQMTGLELTANLYVRRGGSDVESRRRCLEAATEDLAKLGVDRLVLELSDGDFAADKRTLFRAKQESDASFTYHHLRAPQEPILWVADGVAWAWSQGGPWRSAISKLVGEIRQVLP